MALSAARLKDNIKAVYLDAEANGGNTREDQLDYFCEKLAEVLVNEIKELTIGYTNGLVAGATAVTGVINHTVS